ncbi:MAG TPA: nitrous oxide-stimulated promoter family protein [Casimicrobiaceae bacterium]|nr:nitrous oxide-stimulated promoter family protein [Casimicrobiaceae bacterium]
MARSIPIADPNRPARFRTLEAHRGRELDTIEAMFRIYCRAHHRRQTVDCDDCGELLDYATRRLVRCVFGANKPTCANCAVHCYSETMRARIHDVMRYAGPRMTWRHPFLAIHHVLAGRRPSLPTRKSPRP